MPHESGRDVDIVASLAGYRLAGTNALIDSLLSQIPGDRGYTLENKGDLWNLYVPSGDSYDAAHGFFSNTVYAIGTTVVVETQPDVESTTPVSEEALEEGVFGTFFEDFMSSAGGVVDSAQLIFDRILGLNEVGSTLDSLVDWFKAALEQAPQPAANQEAGPGLSLDGSNPVTGITNEAARILGFQFRR